MSGNINSLISETTQRMDNALKAMHQNFQSVRTGKASPALVENVMVDYYGTSTKLRDIASITAPEPRLVVIQPWDQNAVANIEKAIQSSDVGVSPVSDGRVIRLPIPELSEERRSEYTKLVKKQAEDTRVEVRNVRRDANEQVKKAQKTSEITEDDMRDMLDDIQKLTDNHIKRIDEELEAKVEELMQV
jgi:ribosome recycling factor